MSLRLFLYSFPERVDAYASRELGKLVDDSSTKGVFNPLVMWHA